MRRAREARFLTTYARVLAEHGIRTRSQLSVAAISRNLSYPFEAMIVSLAAGEMIEPESNHELIRCVAGAVDDPDAFAAIPI